LAHSSHGAKKILHSATENAKIHGYVGFVASPNEYGASTEELMNPQERAVIDGIFERLRSVANQPRDAEVERYIADLVRQQPYAPYAMAQSIYVQEQALLNQQQEIEQLKADVEQLRQQPPAPQQSGGFLSGLFGGGQPARAPEPPAYGQRGQQSMAPQAGPWGNQPPAQQAPAPEPPKQGMGFLGTAAAAAAGVAGGMMIGNILSSAFGGGGARADHGSGFGGQNFLGQTPSAGSAASENPQISPDSHGSEPDYASDFGGDDSFGDDSFEL
jgi:uncharacterized protein